jgi:linoleoyl-CoA desaturase
VDADIVQTKLLRLAPTQKWRPIHRFQHIYAPFLYALAHGVWIFQNDFEKYFTQKVLNMPIKNFGTKERIIFWITKILYATVYLVIPILVLGPNVALTGFAVVSLSCGFILTLVFQLAHVVEITEFEDGVNGIEIENEWAVHQVNTTADFATDNKVVSWFLGGLNFQVVHHLFPKISHIHYPALQKIVEKSCKAYNVEYRSFPTVIQAINSHFRMMRSMGQPTYVHHEGLLATSN